MITSPFPSRQSLLPGPSPFWSLTRFRELLRRDDGVTMIIVVSVMFITSLLLVAAFTAADGEIHLTKTDRAEKKAYYAAEAGIQDYEYHLTQDGNYLDYCASPTPANPALNEFGSTTHHATVPASSSESEPTHEEYAIQLIPAESSKEKKCNPNNLVETMIEEKAPATGTFRIESTGYSEGAERTIVATFKNLNFVSFVWYTKYETGDPVTYGTPPSGKPEYYNECANFYGKRPEQTLPQNASVTAPVRCTNNYFFGGEYVNGPFHTEDAGGICGNPVLGRNETDRIEFHNDGGGAGEKGYSSENCGKSAEPQFKGTYIPPKEVKSIEPPPGDEELVHVVESEYLFKEKTEIILEGKTMTVIQHKGAGDTGNPETEEKVKPKIPFPPNGVIYVEGGCTEKYSPFGPVPRYEGNELGEPTDTKCGNVWVHGNYEESLTIASENDVVINGNITTPTNSEGVPTGNALLGLVANNFVRIYHPVKETYEGKGPELETSGGHQEVIKVEPKSGSVGKEISVEIKESGSEDEVIVQNTTKNEKEVKKVANALALNGKTILSAEFKEGSKYSQGESEKLKPTTSSKWLDEKCKTYYDEDEKTTLTEQFSTTVHMCEYTDKGVFACDAPNYESKDLKEPTIYAAMLAVKHGVIVDNFSCGEPSQLGTGGKEGKLNIYGAVAGLYTNGDSGAFYENPQKGHGYGYNATYDNRLEAEEPPHFLNPIEAAWYVQRQTIAPNP
jgi:Tfp pilus assembly protein PilX